MRNMEHYLHSDDTEELIKSFKKFDKAAIKAAIISHLEANPKDTIEYSKDFLWKTKRSIQEQTS